MAVVESVTRRRVPSSDKESSLKISTSVEPLPSGCERLSEPRDASVIGCSLLDTRYRDKLMIQVQTERRWVADTKPCQQLAVVTTTNCSICHGWRGEEAVPGTAIQMPNLIPSQSVRLQHGSTPAANPPSRTHCRGLDLKSEHFSI